jgi:rhodanese-related sulfurtransferase
MDTISFEEAKQLMDSRPDHLLLDVRDEVEYITGHADGAVLLPLDDITAASAAAAIPSLDTTLLVYCRSGRRSRLAANKLECLGYTQVYDIGSLVGWPYGMEW